MVPAIEGVLSQSRDVPFNNMAVELVTVELRTSSTKGGENSLQTCNVLFYYLDYLYYIKQLDIEQ